MKTRVNIDGESKDNVRARVGTPRVKCEIRVRVCTSLIFPVDRVCVAALERRLREVVLVPPSHWPRGTKLQLRLG